eukprot:gene2646-5548_t
MQNRKGSNADTTRSDETREGIFGDDLPSIDKLLQGSKGSNPVYFNWLSLCKEEGGTQAKEAMEGHLTSFGVVSALMGTFFIGGIQSPPQRDGEELTHNDLQMQLYIHAAAVAFLLNLFSVMLIVILYAYVTLYTGEEFAVYINRYALLSASLPPTMVALSAVIGMMAIIVRIRIVYGAPAWMVISSVCGIGAILLLFLLFRMEISTTRFRRSRNRKSSTTTVPTAIIELDKEQH